MNDNTEDTQSVVQIDELNLDKECVRLPGDYLKYARLAADMKRKADEADNRLEVVKADVAKDIRYRPQDYGLEKVTEAAVKEATTTDPKYQKALALLQDAQHESALTQAVVWALEHKKRSLTLLVELHGLGYFSEVKISKQGREAVEEMTKRKVRRSHMHED